MPLTAKDASEKRHIYEAKLECGDSCYIDEECPICAFEVVDGDGNLQAKPRRRPTLTLCGHTFCKGCVRKVIRQQVKNCSEYYTRLTCPICRELWIEEWGPSPLRDTKILADFVCLDYISSRRIPTYIDNGTIWTDEELQLEVESLLRKN